MDFSLWTVDRVFSRELPDVNCDGVITAHDAVLAVARELAGLTADFDDSAFVDASDLSHVLNQIGLTDVGAAEGDITGDGLVDSSDAAEAIGKRGQQPSLNPIDIAVSMLEPLIDLAGAALPTQLPATPVCPAPETCGSARCKAKCQNSTTGVSWTYRLFMIGFCGSQFEATTCCQAAAAVACTCSPDEFEFSCWVNAQGTFIACLLALPG